MHLQDERLRGAVERNGEVWETVASYFEDRTDVQCQHRWTKVVNPQLVKGPWTKEVRPFQKPIPRVANWTFQVRAYCLKRFTVLYHERTPAQSIFSINSIWHSDTFFYAGGRAGRSIGAPIWAEEVDADRQTLERTHRKTVQREVAQSPRSQHQQVSMDRRGGPLAGPSSRAVRQSVGQDCQTSAWQVIQSEMFSLSLD